MLRGLLKKKNNIKQNIITDSKELYKLNAEREFSYAIEFVNNAIEGETKIEDKIKMIDFIMDLIKEDIKTDLLTKIIYNPEANITRYFPFPMCYYDKNNNAYRLHEGEEIEIDLSNECVITYPYNREKYVKNIRTISKEPFIYKNNNHTAYYFSQVNICYIANGYHSIASGIMCNKGKIKAKKIDITPLYDYVYTNGVYWYNTHTNNILTTLTDFRIGILYEIAKIKNNLAKI
ncbi:DUF6710 family protein [Caldicellulosiruptoraceae bacterium PP1]